VGDGDAVEELAARWRAELEAWAVPAEILAQAREDPWTHPPEDFAVLAGSPVETPSSPFEREALPPLGTVLDVGCGGGRASLALVPRASNVVGVDVSGSMLERFAAAASARGVAHAAYEGRWPDIADAVPPADLVVCHHVVYNAPDIVAFLDALSDHARNGVVVELTPRHPQATWSPAWEHFWDLERPVGPTADDLIALVAALGATPEVWHQERHGDDPLADLDRAVRSTRRRLCLSPERDDEVAEYLVAHPLRRASDVVTVRWQGRARSR
jgi:SAM-dependent methyltransferase